MDALLVERKERLEKSYRDVTKTYDLETRIEEKLRLKAVLEGIEQELHGVNTKLGIMHTRPVVHSDRLPAVNGEFFGREAELRMLDEVWKGAVSGREAGETRIIQFIAAGGTGKTKLIRHWLDSTEPEHVIAWSFYSQGSNEDKQTSATPFFTHAFQLLGTTRDTFNTEEDKGEHLAELLRRQRCVLVLDGLDPLQYAGSGMCGELKDRALRQLLKSLTGCNNGLCIITTRIAVYELVQRPHVSSLDLHNLAPDDGVKLLASLGVRGLPGEMLKAVHEYDCHALALHLLGNALYTYLEGDVHQRDTLDALIDNYDAAGRHAFKVMQAYSHWLANTPELKLLYLLGLFDHPIELKMLDVL